LKKLAGSVRFRFYKQKTEKTKLNRNRQKTGKKPSQNQAKLEKQSQTEKNRAKTGKTRPKPEKPGQTSLNRFCPKKPNRTETGRFDLVLVRFFFSKKKIFDLVTFFDKNRTELKMITPTRNLSFCATFIFYFEVRSKISTSGVIFAS